MTIPSMGAMSLSCFDRLRVYQDGFSDIPASSWYYAGVRDVYEYGIMEGKNADVFDPMGSLTIAETIKIAASLHKCYYTGTMDFEPGSPWYSPYVDYALSNNILAGPYRNYDAAIIRSDFAAILSNALPDEAITPMNKVDDGAIPDVFESYSYGQAVYKLYRAGVLTGSDGKGTFYPGRSLTRAEAATAIMRIVDANTRVSLWLVVELTAEQIYKKASPAVFYVEILGTDDTILKTGSGFFISESGMAITNYHVVIGASRMRIITDDGEDYDVAGIYDFDWKMDAAIIQIDGEGFPYLELADSSRLLTGATVYALGSPLRLQASFSKGIVSQSVREIDGTEYIQLDAAISSGSSGGALIDSAGRVAGVTSATILGAQNINLAVPINFFKALSVENYVPLEDILIPTEYYEDHYPAPDFGDYFDVRLFNRENNRGGISFSYRVSDLPRNSKEMIDEYTYLIEQNFFSLYGYTTKDGATYTMYYNSKHNIMVVFGLDRVLNTDCFTVTVTKV